MRRGGTNQKEQIRARARKGRTKLPPKGVPKGRKRKRKHESIIHADGVSTAPNESSPLMTPGGPV